MFERFTDRARRVVVLSQEEARLLNHAYIGTEHLLLGLLHEGEGVAAQVLTSLGIQLDTARAEVTELVGRGEGTPAGHMPFTPRAKKVLELSLREALQLGHNYIGTEHVLLGLVREGEGIAARVLTGWGLSLPQVRQEVVLALRRGGPWPRVHQPPAREAPVATGVYTPAADEAIMHASSLAAGQPVGTHHLLAALAGAEGSLAQRALAEAGVDRDALAELATSLDPKGSTDELPEEAGARRTTIQLIGDKVAVLLDDAALRDRLAGAMGRMGRDLLTRATDPGSTFPRLWRSVHAAVGEVVAHVEGETSGPAGWRPPEWPEEPGVAGYAVIAGPALRSIVEFAPGVDRDAVRAGLAAWLEAHQPSGKEAKQAYEYLAVTVGPPAEPSGWGEVTQFGGRRSPELRGPPAPLQVLVAYAITDLRQAPPPAGEAGEPPAAPPPGA